MSGTTNSLSVNLARVQLWLLRTGAFAIPLVMLWTVNDQVALPKLLAARTLALLLAALLIIRRARGEFRIRRTPLDLPIAAYVISAGVSTIFAANANLAVFGAYGRWEGFLTVATYASLFWLASQSVTNQAEAHSVFRAILAGAFVVSLIAIAQVVGTTLIAPPNSESATGFDGVARATATFGNANVLAAYLAMVVPLGVNEFLSAKTWSDRVLTGNLAALMTLALALTFGRGGWVGAAIGVLIVLVAARPSIRRVVFAGATVLAVIGVAAWFVAALGSGGPPIVRSTAARLISLFDPTAGTGAIRLHIWRDTLAMIASRSLAGFGPDNFALAFPQFQTGPWSGSQVIDEAHSELLQIGATQGLFGVAAAAWLCLAVLRLCLGARNDLGAAVLGAFAAYTVTLLVNFSAPPAALTFWLFLGAATRISFQIQAQPAAVRPHRRAHSVASAVGLVALAAVTIPALALPYLGDVRMRDALSAFAAGDNARASEMAAEARSVEPTVSVYAAVAGNVAMARDDWVAAREAYVEAAQLGAFDPSVYRQLAIADERLGLQREAVAAARKAVELDRFDPRNQAVLREVTSTCAASAC